MRGARTYLLAIVLGIVLGLVSLPVGHALAATTDHTSHRTEQSGTAPAATPVAMCCALPDLPPITGVAVNRRPKPVGWFPVSRALRPGDPTPPEPPPPRH